MGEGNPGIDVRIRANNFDEFVSKVEKLQASMKKSADAWKNMTAGNKAVYLTVKMITNSMATVVNLSKSFATNMLKVFTGFESWARDVGRIGRIFGAGGIFGIDTAVRDAMNRNREARGLGINTSELTAFGLKFDKYLSSSDSFLSKVAQAKFNRGSDPYKAVAGSLGIPDSDIDKLSVTDLGVLILKKSQEFARSGNAGDLITRARGNRITSLLDDSELIGLRRVNPDSLNESATGYEEDKAKYKISDDDQKKLADLWSTFEGFLASVNTGFLKLLADSAPLLKDLSDELGNIIKTFLDSTPAHDIVKGLVDKLKELLTWVTNMGPEGMGKQLRDLFTHLTEDAKILLQVLDLLVPGLKLLTPPSDGGTATVTPSTGDTPPAGYKTTTDDKGNSIMVPDEPAKPLRSRKDPDSPPQTGIVNSGRHGWLRRTFIDPWTEPSYSVSPHKGRNLDPMNWNSINPSTTNSSNSTNPYGTISPSSTNPTYNSMPTPVHTPTPTLSPTHPPLSSIPLNDKHSSIASVLRVAANTTHPQQITHINVGDIPPNSSRRNISQGYGANRRQLAMNIYSAPGTNAAVSIGAAGIELT